MTTKLTDETRLHRGDVIFNIPCSEYYIVAMTDHDFFALISLQNGNRFTEPRKTDFHGQLYITAKILFDDCTSTSIDRWVKIEEPIARFAKQFFKNTGAQL
jgi:hypothetical protein